MDEKVQIRLAKETDHPTLVRWLKDPAVMPWFPLDNEKEIEDAVRIWLSYIPQGSAYTLEYEGQLAGMAVIYLHKYKKLRHQSLFAIIMDERFRGKGLGTLFMNELKRRSKEVHKLEILHLEVYEGNPAQRLYERLGFKEYGRQTHFLKEKNGVYRTKINMQLEL